MTYLAVPIAAKNLTSAKQQISRAIKAGAEMLELRCDYLQNITPALVEKLITTARTACTLPIITTCRDSWQGGANDYPVNLRIDVLTAALAAGADFIDVEYENFLVPENRQKIEPALSQNPKSRLILSAHNFKTKFDNISDLHRQIRASCPSAVPKLIYTAEHINDCFDAFDLLHKAESNIIVFCMGQAGLASRIIAKKLDCLVTFAGLDKQTTTAPGQLTVDELKNLYRYDKINPATELYGIIGSPVVHSLSPAVHNACFDDLNLNKLYLPLLVEGNKSDFDEFLNNLLERTWLDFCGLSVTIPHKQNALAFTHQQQGTIEPLAEKIGAANTLVIERRATGDGRRISAYNTDYTGALDAITSSFDIERSDLNGMKIAVIGAGGVARAVVAGLLDAGAKVRIYNRTVRRGEKLAAEFNCSFAPLEKLSQLSADLLINCTSIGMYPEVQAMPVLKEYLKKDMAVFDTVYNPQETLLLKRAKQIGAKTISGREMFISQARLQFKFFTDKNPNTQLMRKAISDKLSH